MKLFNDESFGPNVSIVRVKDAADAIEISNGSGFGLSSSIFTNDIMEGLAIAKLLETGAVSCYQPVHRIDRLTVQVHLNSGSVHDEPTIPHGGHKNSGHGRFNGAYAIQSFTQTKTVRFGNLGAIPLHILKN
jgi:acyl-CoA reductase-like NAD-dependent aldehyde dehydrogenase